MIFGEGIEDRKGGDFGEEIREREGMISWREVLGKAVGGFWMWAIPSRCLWIPEESPAARSPAPKRKKNSPWEGRPRNSAGG
jgi:hypothetical protein